MAIGRRTEETRQARDLLRATQEVTQFVAVHPDTELAKAQKIIDKASEQSILSVWNAAKHISSQIAQENSQRSRENQMSPEEKAGRIALLSQETVFPTENLKSALIASALASSESLAGQHFETLFVIYKNHNLDESDNFLSFIRELRQAQRNRDQYVKQHFKQGTVHLDLKASIEKRTTLIAEAADKFPYPGMESENAAVS